MLMFDQSTLLADVSPTVLVAESRNSKESAAGDSHSVAWCRLIMLDDAGDGAARLYPLEQVKDFFLRDRYRKNVDWDKGAISVVQQPQHGEISMFESLGLRDATYYAEHGYTGNDSLILKVQGVDYSLEIHYFFRIIEQQGTSGKEIYDNPNCKAEEWTISATMPQTRVVGGNALADYLLKHLYVSFSIGALSKGRLQIADKLSIHDDYGAGVGS
ncbi:MAG TPA: hypothetical protein VG962_15480 [Steroidobacteraceae bacterium]|nr:hypothetical protein [Steroidobacteraceae bacterium]